jgi:hypothetical protein
MSLLELLGLDLRVNALFDSILLSSCCCSSGGVGALRWCSGGRVPSGVVVVVSTGAAADDHGSSCWCWCPVQATAPVFFDLDVSYITMPPRKVSLCLLMPPYFSWIVLCMFDCLLEWTKETPAKKD